MFEKHNSEALVICRPDRKLDREVLVYLKSVFRHVREIDLTQTKLTGTQIQEISMNLEIPVKELFDLRNEKIQGLSDYLDDADPQDLIKILRHSPTLMRTPIVSCKDCSIIVNSLGKMMEFMERKVLAK